MIKHSLFLAIALATASSAALAAKADKNAALYQGMDAAGQRYREARIKMQAGDETGMAQLTKALEDLEDLAQQCIRLRGCDTTRVITQYEVLIKSQDLKADDMELAGEDSGNEEDPDHVQSPVLANSPEAKRTLSLLGDGHDFDKMVEVNEPVQAAMRDWLTTQRAFLIDAWENYQYMRYLMSPRTRQRRLHQRAIRRAQPQSRIHHRRLQRR
ncbi:MAG: hypothetical protein NT117_07705 [Gammaproteobacteria bacterium]|nr:hypothetical protein [Gammaproteobacteria bacterium]